MIWYEIEGFKKYLYNPNSKLFKNKKGLILKQSIKNNKPGTNLVRDGFLNKKAFVYFDSLVLNDDHVYEVR